MDLDKVKIDFKKYGQIGVEFWSTKRNIDLSFQRSLGCCIHYSKISNFNYDSFFIGDIFILVT